MARCPWCQGVAQEIGPASDGLKPDEKEFSCAPCGLEYIAKSGMTTVIKFPRGKFEGKELRVYGRKR